MRRLSIVTVLLCLSSAAFAGAKEDGQAIVDKFVADFSAANADDMAALFTPDALFWGSRGFDLITTSEGVHQYFANAFKTLPGSKATLVGPASVTALSDDAVDVAGIWEVTAQVAGKPVVVQLRYSMTAVKRGDHWLIASFHTSPRPTR